LSTPLRGTIIKQTRDRGWRINRGQTFIPSSIIISAMEGESKEEELWYTILGSMGGASRHTEVKNSW
jgi:hypothetical protein